MCYIEKEENMVQAWWMPMAKSTAVFFIAITLLGGCKNSSDKPENSRVAEAAPLQYNDPPILDVGLSVEQAYAAIPHRRTILGRERIPGFTRRKGLFESDVPGLRSSSGCPSDKSTKFFEPAV